jgi:hypothetical protein
MQLHLQHAGWQPATTARPDCCTSAPGYGLTGTHTATLAAVACLLWALLVAASPVLHHDLHGAEALSADHHCLATLLSQGGIETTFTLVAASSPPHQFSASPSPHPVPPFRSWKGRRRNRAPPVSSR